MDYTANDGVIQSALGIRQLETQLKRELAGKVAELQLVPRERGLVLRGFSASFYGKQLAQQTLMAATDLPLVANEIEVHARKSRLDEFD